MRSSLRSAALAGMCLMAAAMLAHGAGQNAPKARVALTFDDLPAHGPLPPGLTRLDIARSILGTLKEHNAPPTYGFLNARQLETTPTDIDVLQAWRAAGHPLGNHAFSHMDLHANTAAAFEQDVLANEATLRTLMGDQRLALVPLSRISAKATRRTSTRRFASRWRSTAIASRR